MVLESGCERMAKQGRSVQLPQDIYTFTEAYESKTGVKFNRQVLAALLRFLLEDFDLPNTLWVSLASSVDRGSMKIEDLPLQLAEIDVKEWENNVHRKEIRDITKVSLDEAKVKLAIAKERLRRWKARIDQHGDAKKALLENIHGSVLHKILAEYVYDNATGRIVETDE